MKLNQIMKAASGWLNEHGLQLATQKTVIAVLTRKQIKTYFLITVLGKEI